ncbi:universal stress protein [Streptomyces sp. NBC_00257]|uniref:universal stress protein n=1 Tax=unclassified Streptomyces TaxID=2593676 RepID=UPI0022573ED6|nr:MULTISPECIES: universal stress protein [unclassified Streptomyces]MCX5427079.1 universal stress protein [Streptomyces sp. NBC_00062]WTB58844.1 universal stress protein [Streptomyces sp. NBC_00826]WTH88279.1 universal stress protein [Streptomyces sp. NBC_00825]WTH97007.1 universal stress protein [Streptomyces sp. NBC_00822]
MQLPIVVGVDGSEGSLRALDWAAAESARSRLPLRVVHASLWEHYEGMRPTFDTGRPAEQILAEHLVASAQERVHRLHAEVRVVADVQPEDPVNALVRESHEAALVVLGSRGRGRIAGMLLGSVSLAVAGRSHCPVVVIPAAAPNAQPKPGRVVVGIGDAPGPSAAARFALAQAAARHGELIAVRAWRCPAHETADHPLLAGSPASAHRRQAEEHLEDVLAVLERTESETDVHRSVVQGPAHQVLIEETEGAELLVVGARRAGGHHGPHLGPVNHAVLHYASCPVAVVPDTR